jgi:TolB-like protein/DNA-binding winged helix-turn-helix (wHTH) protein/Tfp pilus assembly protein PilF
MPAPACSTERVQFGVFELDLRRAELRKSGVKVRLQEQPLKILEVLLENPGQIVGREELQQRIWPANTFVEFDQGLYSAMARLRDALGDSSDSPRFIETVARRGYRFIAPVTVPAAALIAEAASDDQDKVKPDTTLTLRRLTANLLAGLLGGALLLAIVLIFDIAGAREWLRNRTTPIRSVAVLPLENLSGDPEQEYFADGVTDELITDLAQLPYLQVISRTSVMHYKNTKKTLPEIARELNVDAVVEGSVARSGNHVRIRVQLIRAGDDRHLWAQAYEREIRDVLSMQADAAVQIADQVGSNLARGAPSLLGHTRSMKPEAYDNYLKGRYYARTRKRTDVAQAAAYFREAIRQDPEAALAYAGLADAYLFEFNFGSDPQEAAAKTRSVASKALEIDPHLAEPHVILAILAESDWDWAGAEKEYKQAIELEPSSPQAHHQRAIFLAAMGRRSEAVAEVETAVKLDPLSGNTHANAGFAYSFVGEYDRCIDESQKALQIEPAIVTARAHLVDCYREKGLDDQSIAEFEKYAVQRDFSPGSVAFIKDAYRKSGIKGFWQAHIDLDTRGQIPPLDNGFLAAVYSELGDKSKALDYLDKAYAAHDSMLEFLKATPEFDDLRSEPRFQKLVRIVGLPQPELAH